MEDSQYKLNASQLVEQLKSGTLSREELMTKLKSNNTHNYIKSNNPSYDYGIN